MFNGEVGLTCCAKSRLSRPIKTLRNTDSRFTWSESCMEPPRGVGDGLFSVGITRLRDISSDLRSLPGQPRLPPRFLGDRFPHICERFILGWPGGLPSRLVSMEFASLPSLSSSSSPSSPLGQGPSDRHPCGALRISLSYRGYIRVVFLTGFRQASTSLLVVVAFRLTVQGPEPLGNH